MSLLGGGQFSNRRDPVDGIHVAYVVCATREVAFWGGRERWGGNLEEKGCCVCLC